MWIGITTLKWLPWSTKVPTLRYNQWSVFQYLGTEKYRFILCILILIFFTEVILISILNLIILNFVLKYWKILSIFQYQNRMCKTLLLLIKCIIIEYISSHISPNSKPQQLCIDHCSWFEFYRNVEGKWVYCVFKIVIWQW